MGHGSDRYGCSTPVWFEAVWHEASSWPDASSRSGSTVPADSHLGTGGIEAGERGGKQGISSIGTISGMSGSVSQLELLAEE